MKDTMAAAPPPVAIQMSSDERSKGADNDHLQQKTKTPATIPYRDDGRRVLRSWPSYSVTSSLHLFRVLGYSGMAPTLHVQFASHGSILLDQCDRQFGAINPALFEGAQNAAQLRDEREQAWRIGV